jgi:rhomboid protease GluP
MILVYRSLRAQDCMERSLVLAAMGIDYFVQRTWWGWCLLVDDAAADESRTQLALYEQERRVAGAAHGSPPARSGVRAGVLAYAFVLLGVFFMQGNHGFGFDWTAAGRVDVAAIRAGEYWRTVTALTLHRDLWHLLSNLGFGLIFALLLSRQLGGGVAWLLILVGGACGNWMNAVVQPPQHLSIGASTAVFAALGLLATYFFSAGQLTRETWARRWAPIVGGLWVLAWLGTGDAQTDVVAHLTGFVAGFLLGSVIGRISPTAERDGFLQGLAGLLAMAVVVGAWFLALG